MTENFKQKCREATYKNKLGKLLFDNDYEINGTDYLTEISTEETIFTNGTILGSCNSKLLKASSLNDLEITDDHLEALVGIKYDSSSEYLSLGKFTITEKVYDKTNRKTEIKALDEFIKLDVDKDGKKVNLYIANMPTTGYRVRIYKVDKNGKAFKRTAVFSSSPAAAISSLTAPKILPIHEFSLS